MEDLTKRIINSLRKAVTNARNADDAGEAAALADALDAEGAPIAGTLLPEVPAELQPLKGGTTVDPASIPEQPPVSNDFVAPGATPFAHLPLTGAESPEPFPHPDVRG